MPASLLQKAINKYQTGEAQNSVSPTRVSSIFKKGDKNERH